jgi:hypothetical protein
MNALEYTLDNKKVYIFFYCHVNYVPYAGTRVENLLFDFLKD